MLFLFLINENKKIKKSAKNREDQRLLVLKLVFLVTIANHARKKQNNKKQYLVNKLDLFIRMPLDDYVRMELLIMHRLNSTM